MAYGLQAFFGGLIWLLFTRAGSFILAATGQPMEEIGSFSAGFNPVVKLVAMVASGSGALLPGMVALVVAGNVLKARTWVSAQARYMTALAMLGVAAMGFVGVPLLVTVLGRKYLAVGTIAAFSVVAVFPLVLDMLARSVAVAWGHARLSVEVFVLVGVLFVGTGLGLVPAHGALGLVAAVIVASIGACTYSNVRLRMWTGVWALGWSWLLAIALGAPGAISFFVELSWPLRIGGLVGFCCYYALVLILLGITPLEEIQDFWRNLRHRGIEER